MPSKIMLLALYASAAFAAPAAAPPAPLTLYIVGEPSPPAAMREGDDITGRETEKIRMLMQRSGTNYRIDLLPWKRAYVLVQQRPDMCVYSMSRTPEREALFNWVGPTDEADWVFYGRAEQNLRLRTLEDARPLRIGTYAGDARDSFLRAHGFNVDSTPNDATNPEKLLAHRIDLWAVGIRAGSGPLTQFAWSDRLVPVLTFNHINVYLACNRAVPDAVILQLNTTLATLRRDGSFKTIEQKYERWSAPK